jgi:CDP-diacylglycerol--serine O-phosphatidyltransferase
MTRHFPNFLTLISLVLGFSELGAVLSGHSELAAGLLLWALLLDGLAGQFARKRNRSSELGAELDSLAALMAFGISVMVLAFERSLIDLGPMGWIVAVGAAVATALRLSRDNPSNPDWPRYQGLPVPAFGAAVALLVTSEQVPPDFVAIAVSALAVLMLAPFHYARFSQRLWVQAPLGIFVVAAIIMPQLREIVLFFVLFYALGGAFFEFWGLLESVAPLKPRVRRSRG